jgi:hypothetical protein
MKSYHMLHAAMQENIWATIHIFGSRPTIKRAVTKLTISEVH